MKDTGFEFRVIQGPPEPENDMGATLIRHARKVAEWSNLAGTMVIGIFEDGATSVAFRWDDDRCPVPRSLAPAWIAEIVRRELVTSVEAENTFHDIFEWVE